jgi:hypothetical protein
MGSSTGTRLSAALRYVAACGVGLASCWAFAFLLGRLAVPGVDGPITNPVDFRTFYCGGRVLAEGRDPYRVEPMLSCQRAVLRDGGLRLNAAHVLPAPLPPYALALFALLARLPFAVATEVWLAASIFALGVAIVVTRALCGLSPTVVALAMFASAGFASLILGQLVPLALAGLLLAALCARRGNAPGAAAAAAIGALEPHLAVPVWLGIALCVPRARLALALACAALVLLSLAFGVGLNAEFLTSVLPGHARSEAYNFPAQYSLTALLVTIGAPLRASLFFGSLSYVAMLAAGLALGAHLARRLDDPAFALTTPLATVLIGGPFVHVHQMAAAVPFGLMLLGRLPRGRPAYAGVAFAVAALAIPWETLAEMPFVADHLPPKISSPAPALPPVRADESLEVPYTAFIDAFAQRADPRTLAEQVACKLPTWFGLLGLVAAAVPLSRGRRLAG